MLLMQFTEGKCYSVAELERLLAGSGFAEVAHTPMPAERSIATARRKKKKRGATKWNSVSFGLTNPVWTTLRRTESLLIVLTTDCPHACERAPGTDSCPPVLAGPLAR